jgi:hypothetical protein
MELRFDGKAGNKASKVYVDGFDVVVEMYDGEQLVEKKVFTNWTDDTSASRPSIMTAIKWLDNPKEV